MTMTLAHHCAHFPCGHQEAAESQDDDDVDAGGIVLVPGAVKATGLIPPDTEVCRLYQWSGWLEVTRE